MYYFKSFVWPCTLGLEIKASKVKLLFMVRC